MIFSEYIDISCPHQVKNSITRTDSVINGPVLMMWHCIGMMNIAIGDDGFIGLEKIEGKKLRQ